MLPWLHVRHTLHCLAPFLRVITQLPSLNNITEHYLSRDYS